MGVNGLSCLLKEVLDVTIQICRKVYGLVTEEREGIQEPEGGFDT